MSDGWERTEDGQLMWGGFAGSFCGNIASHHIIEPGLPILYSIVYTRAGIEGPPRFHNHEKGPNFASIYRGLTHVQHCNLIVPSL